MRTTMTEHPLIHRDEDGTSYLLISEIREAERRERLQERFERQLARLRRLSNRRDTTP